MAADPSSLLAPTSLNTDQPLLTTPTVPSDENVNPAKKKGRRSWFMTNTPPVKLADESDPKPAPPDVEVLLLTHFTKPPRIDFGKVKLQKTRKRQLLVRNPHDYDQDVVVEKFPFIKNFSIDMAEFTVAAKSDLCLEIVWEPTEEGNCRQMIQFHVDDAYRLTTIIYGTALAPPQPKRIRKHWGSKSKPFTVLQSKNIPNTQPERTSSGKQQEKIGKASLKISSDQNPVDLSDTENKQPAVPAITQLEAGAETKENLPNVGHTGDPVHSQGSLEEPASHTALDGHVKYSEVDVVVDSVITETIVTVSTPDGKVLREVTKSKNTVTRAQTTTHSPDHNRVHNTTHVTRDTGMASNTHVTRETGTACTPEVSRVQNRTGMPEKTTAPQATALTSPELKTDCNVTRTPEIVRIQNKTHTPEVTREDNSDRAENDNATYTCGEVSDFDFTALLPRTPKNMRRSLTFTKINELTEDEYGAQQKTAQIAAVQTELKVVPQDCPSRDQTAAPGLEVYEAVEKQVSETKTPLYLDTPPADYLKMKRAYMEDTPSKVGYLSPDSFLQGSSRPQLSPDEPNLNMPLNMGTKTDMKVTPNSFLQNSCKKTQPLTREIAVEVQTPLGRETDHVVHVSPNSFLQETYTAPQPQATLEHSPGELFDKSIPHDVLVQQLETVKTELKQRLSSTPRIVPKRLISDTVTKVKPTNEDTNVVVPRSQVDPVNATPDVPDPRRLSTLTVTKTKTGEQDKAALLCKGKKELFRDIPEALGQSPRRTTWTVQKEQEMRRIQSANSPVLSPALPSTPPKEAQVPSVPVFKYPFPHTSPKALPEEYGQSPRRTTWTVDGAVTSTARGKAAAAQVPPHAASNADSHLDQVQEESDQEKEVPNEGVHSVEISPKKKTDLQNKATVQSKPNNPPAKLQKPPLKTVSSSNQGHLSRAMTVSAAAKKKRTHSATRSQSEARKAAVGVQKKVKPSDSVTSLNKDTAESSGAQAAAPVTPVKSILSTERKPTRTEQLRKAVSAKKAKSFKDAKKTKRPVKGLAPSKLVLMKTANKTAIPRHPMPFASKNMYYDERWIEKQEKGFERWLNFILTPEEDVGDGKKPAKVDAGSLCVTSVTVNKLAPTKEVLSLRAYSARRRLNRLRRTACLLFQSEAFVMGVRKIEAEIETGHLAVRKDRKLHADLGIKQVVLDMILSYNPLWLRIGLETTYGEILPLQSNHDVLGMSRFILTRLLGNPEIAAKYSHPTVPHLYRDGYDEALAQFTLKKFLVLVFFLDTAKRARLIEHDPCLFCKDSEFKASRDLLLQFSRDYLRGEGDIIRHLGYLGCQITHAQTALDEFDFAVTKLSKDLRDGVRLARIVELLTRDWSLSSLLRVPAISRLQKIHNVEVALKALANRGLDVTTPQGGAINPRDVVDGHREKTLAMLWRVIFNFQVDVLLNLDQLREEVDFLKKTLCVKTHLTAVLNYENDLGLERGGRRESMEPDLYFKSNGLSLLLKWCKAVCAFYNLKVENFTVSFSDGRALCYLVHHYHPSLLPLESIKTDTTQSYQEQENENSDAEDSFHGTWSMSYSLTSGRSPVYDQLLANEKENFKVLYEKVTELGGVPLMLKSTEMSNTIPDEKVVITYVSYLCGRLLDIRHETRAARTIQVAWRKYRLTKVLQLNQVKAVAIIKIQRAFRCFLKKRSLVKQTSAVIRIQSWWRGVVARQRVIQMRHQVELARKSRAVVVVQTAVRKFLLRRHLARSHAARILSKQTKAAVVIQSAFRAHREKTAFIATKRAAIVLQTHVRRCQTRAVFLKLKQGALLIQQWYRAQKCVQRDRREYQHLKQAVSTLQQRYRAQKDMQRGKEGFQKLRRAAITLQQRYRAKKCMERSMQEFQRLKYATLKLQQRYRAQRCMQRDKQEYQAVKQAVSTIQQRYRAQKCMQRHRQEFQQLRRAVLAIQQKYRAQKQMQREFEEFQNLRQAALIVQHRYRAQKLMQRNRKEFHQLKRAVVTLQRRYRAQKQMQVNKEEFQLLRQAVLLVQRRYRACLCMRRSQQEFSHLKQAALTLQQRWRAQKSMQKSRQEYACMKSAAVTVQSVFRMCLERRRYEQLRRATVKAQALWRQRMARRRYKELQRAALVLQTRLRAWRLGQEQRLRYNILLGATITLQAAWRGHVIREAYLRQRKAAILIQSAVRRHMALQRFKELRRAAVIIQRRFREKMLCRSWFMYFHIHRGAAIVIAAAVRGWIARRRYLAMQQACLTIQRYARGWAARKHFLETKKACVTLQKYTRGWVAKKQYLKTKYACVTLQKYTRGWVARKHYLETKETCVTIQKYIRGWVARKQYLDTKWACVTMQKYARAYIARKHYIEIRNAALVLQTYTRAMLQARKERVRYAQQRQAAIVIQAAYRARRARQFVHYLRCVINMQALVRASIARNRYLRLRAACVTLQAWVRGCLVAKRYHDVRQATVSMQRVYRSNKLTRERMTEYQKLRQACIVLQAATRGLMVRKEMARKRQAAILVQSWVKMKQTREKFVTLRNAALVIQDRFRAHAKQCEEREAFLDTRSKIVKLQSAVRCFQARKAYLDTRTKVVTIQSAIRQYLARRRYQNTKNCVVIIQSAIRRHLARRAYLNTKAKAVKMQAAVRGHLARQAYLGTRAKVVKLQSHVRAYQQRRQFLTVKEAVMTIQRVWRAVLLTREVRREYQIAVGAAITIQAAVRGHQTRCCYTRMRQAAIKIQSFVRGATARDRYHRQLRAVRVLQQHTRAVIQGRKERREFLIRVGAAITIQAWVRGHMVRNKVKAIRAAVVIQKVYRGYRQRKQYQAMKEAAIVLQSYVRRLIAQKTYRRMVCEHRAAVCIQRVYRGYRLHKVLEEQRQKRAAVLSKVVHVAKTHLAAIRLQRSYRNYRAMLVARQKITSVLILQRWIRAKLQRVNYLKLRAGITRLQSLVRQRLVRRHQAATSIQALVRGWQGRRQAQKWQDAIVTIQAIWRGRKTRQQMKDKKVIQVRRRLKEATMAATEEKKLCNRTTSALDFLLQYKQLSYILEALVHLDAATRLSSRCCERMVEGNAVGVIYTLIRSCNRSLPHMEIIKYSVNILLNLAKYDKTRQAVYQVEDSVDTLVELMQIYRDKGSSIFCKVCTLMGILCQDRARREEILKLPKMSDRLRSIHTLTLRKHSLNENRLIKKSKMAATKSYPGSTYVPFTPSKRPMKIRPDWILRRDKMNDVSDPLHAVTFVMESLQLSAK
ncbi:abnormal spindle-like microcephaly-associated protein homolog [Lingula anatina]|uniref:Abnormal spindle-like microcephaly-associated protein homolog n=1 Tax=Lingula anatina TaxID=7574 RepID=A0A1S3I7N6_LINAN|nr:abnormal spindle-like microcephaly-associated protein homolog [Lingula anatina]|eukprot:XP_013394208.1 abnormal spindle-like microcephaly-associated protein homolog [Lingula anatina]